mmetsp:Transcript_22961/g.44729  ORF Transcript_22961/g.44729 Transcript_22961/m.44729 type:complete len:147 (-) Transcript_22961:356-796(-)
MVSLYEARGISRKDAELVIKTLAKYKDAFIDIMMVEELGMNPHDDENAVVGGLVTFCSFVLFGSVPLLSYLVALIPSVDIGSDLQLKLSLVLTAATMFALGAIKGSYVGSPWWYAGLSMMVTGCLAALAGWVIGYVLASAGLHDSQ